jgi:hypothetical protein
MPGDGRKEAVMAVNSANARIFGSDTDAIYLAPLGTPLPTSIDDPLNPAFEDIGWLHSDGITETFTGSKSEIRGHQGQRVVRTRIETPGTTIGFHALESKPQTKGLRYDEKSVSVTNGVRKVRRGAGQKVQARAAVVDVFDADDVTVKERHVIERFEVVADGDRVFAGSDIAGFPFLGEIIGDYDSYESAGVSQTADEWDVTISGTPTGGTYTLSVNGFATAGIAYNANAAAVAAAVNALSGVTGVSGVTASGTVKLVFPVAVVLAADGSNLTGGTDPDVAVAPSA